MGDRGNRADEREAVRTTIVGGRPPGSGTDIGAIPRGIEVLVKKASVDPGFKEALLNLRAEAARQIGLELTPVEAMMLNAAPREQIAAIVSRTRVEPGSRAAFLGRVAAAMIVALSVATEGCSDRPASRGIQPDETPNLVTDGIRPDVPRERVSESHSRGIRPDNVRRNVVSLGIRPDEEGTADPKSKSKP